MLRRFGVPYAAPLLEALADSKPSLSVRHNALKGCNPPHDADLVPWCEAGAYLSDRPVFAADPAWHQGLYYVQDASSMAYAAAVKRIVADCFDGRDSLLYLDACAAPGGKTGTALEALPPGSLVAANELDPRRAAVLVENMARLGSPDVVISRGDATAYARTGVTFDIIAVDAPCSGEGMMRKEPEAVAQWSPALIERCAETQRRIVADLWKALAPGGVMIYSTCTFNTSENEDIVSFIAKSLGGESLDLGLDSFNGVFRGFDPNTFSYRFAPGHIRGEGLFMAALRKPATDATPSKRKKDKGSDRKGSPKTDPQATAFVKAHVINPDKYTIITNKDTIVLRPSAHADTIAALERSLHMLRSGLPVAVIKGRDLMPTHELALSAAIDTDSFATLPLEHDAALEYLHGESLTDMPDGLPKGFVLTTFNGNPLGFVKNIGRRANNLCPDTFRLRIDPKNLA